MNPGKDHSMKSNALELRTFSGDLNRPNIAPFKSEYPCCSDSIKKLCQSSLGSLCPHLSTIVDDYMWISVDILENNHLAQFSVDKQWIRPLTYPQLIHSPEKSLSICKTPMTKKKLDQLSTYPQSLLHLLIYKIYLN